MVIINAGPLERFVTTSMKILPINFRSNTRSLRSLIQFSLYFHVFTAPILLNGAIASPLVPISSSPSTSTSKLPPPQSSVGIPEPAHTHIKGEKGGDTIVSGVNKEKQGFAPPQDGKQEPGEDPSNRRDLEKADENILKLKEARDKLHYISVDKQRDIEEKKKELQYKENLLNRLRVSNKVGEIRTLIGEIEDIRNRIRKDEGILIQLENRIKEKDLLITRIVNTQCMQSQNTIMSLNDECKTVGKKRGHTITIKNGAHDPPEIIHVIEQKTWGSGSRIVGMLQHWARCIIEIIF